MLDKLSLQLNFHDDFVKLVSLQLRNNFSFSRPIIVDAHYQAQNWNYPS